MTAPRIGMLTTIGRNVGDEFIREGVRAILDRVAGQYQPYYVDKHDPDTIRRPVYDEVAPLHDKYFDSDVFVQCGAPVYWHLLEGGARSVDSEWHDWFWRRRVLNAAIGAHPCFVNLGAGSCQPWGDEGGSFVQDEECARFARLAAARSDITTVRDPVAAGILRALGVEAIELPCPAFLASARHGAHRPGHGMIGVNLMPGAGHFRLDAQLDPRTWRKEVSNLVAGLRAEGPIVFVAHDEEEARFQATLAVGPERVFFSRVWQDYLDIYAGCRLALTNRVHGAVCAAGFGVPVVIVGNDTRASIGNYIGVPVLRAAQMRAEEALETVGRLLRDRDGECGRLGALRESTLQRYVDLLKAVAPFRDGAPAGRGKRNLDPSVGYYRIEPGADPARTGEIDAREAASRNEDGKPASIELDFSVEGNARRIATLRGFSGPESWGAWSDACLWRTCSIEFDDPLPESFDLEMRLDAFGPNFGAPVELRVGAFSTRFLLEEHQGTVVIGVDLDGPAHLIEIVPPHPRSPAELGHGPDERRLGIGFRSMTIRTRATRTHANDD